MPTTRREFVKLASLAGANVYLAHNLNWARPQDIRQGRGRSKNVAVLGAGLAGLSAGWTLTNAGYHVTILEAQTSPGGRVHTIREGLSDHLYAEAGAGRIPSTHNVTLEWI